jgi:hypothetical protein
MAGPHDQLPISLDRGDPVIEIFAYEGREVRVSRSHCVDKMGPDRNGLHVFHYEYDLYEFTEGFETLHARSYAIEPEEAHLLAIELDGQRRFLTADDLDKPLPKAAKRYLRRAGKGNLKWLDPNNEEGGYSPIP